MPLVSGAARHEEGTQRRVGWTSWNFCGWGTRVWRCRNFSDTVSGKCKGATLLKSHISSLMPLLMIDLWLYDQVNLAELLDGRKLKFGNEAVTSLGKINDENYESVFLTDENERTLTVALPDAFGNTRVGEFLWWTIILSHLILNLLYTMQSHPNWPVRSWSAKRLMNS